MSKVCEICLASIAHRNWNARYCERCILERRMEQDRQRKRGGKTGKVRAGYRTCPVSRCGSLMGSRSLPICRSCFNSATSEVKDHFLTARNALWTATRPELQQIEVEWSEAKTELVKSLSKRVVRPGPKKRRPIGKVA